MPSIKIAANYITATDTILAGSLRDSGHLQIVYEDGNPNTLLVEAEVQAPTLIFAGDWDYQPFGQPHGAPTDYKRTMIK